MDMSEASRNGKMDALKPGFTKSAMRTNVPHTKPMDDGEHFSGGNRSSLLKLLAIFAVALLVTVTVTCTAIWFMSAGEKVEENDSEQYSGPGFADFNKRLRYPEVDLPEAREEPVMPNQEAKERPVVEVADTREQHQRRPSFAKPPQPPRHPLPPATPPTQHRIPEKTYPSDQENVNKPPIFGGSSSSSSGPAGSSADHNSFLSALLQLANVPPPTGGIFSAEGGSADGGGKRPEGFSIPNLASIFSGSLGGDAFSRLFGNFSSPGSDETESPVDDQSPVSASGNDNKEVESAPGTIDDPAYYPAGSAADTKQQGVEGRRPSAGVRRRPSSDGRLKFKFQGPLSFLTVFSFSAFIVEMLNHALGVRPGGSQFGQNVVRAFSAGEEEKWRSFEDPSQASPAFLPPVDYANSLTRALLSLIKAWQHGGEFYECAWRLFCEDLNDSLDIPGTPGALARINSVGMRAGFGTMKPKEMPAALVRSFLGENRPLKCNRLFHGCPPEIGRKDIYEKMRQLRITPGGKHGKA